ncbi:MAG TPA: hypothetical protein ENI23_12435 [bacterium]|nr:hypothetical protein [bacterium]
MKQKIEIWEDLRKIIEKTMEQNVEIMFLRRKLQFNDSELSIELSKRGFSHIFIESDKNGKLKNVYVKNQLTEDEFRKMEQENVRAASNIINEKFKNQE